MALKTNHGNHLNIFFFPFFARGHMIPMLGVAKLLAERGVGSTIVTTPGNASIFSSTIEDAVMSGHYMELLLIPFPDIGLPPGCENTFDIPSGTDKREIFQALTHLEEPLRQLLSHHRPDCLVGDIGFMDPPTSRVARSVGIPYVDFSPFSAFSGVVIHELHRVFSASSGEKAGPLLGLPHRIEMSRAELPPFFEMPTEHLARIFAPPENRLGILTNTFRELEAEYVELAKDRDKRKMWCVGPLHLNSSRNISKNDQNWEGIKKWLDSRESESVLYVSFGSECSLGSDQLREMASGLEASLRPFVWVVRGGAEAMEEWLPEVFREKVGERGLVLTEWAPQTSILSHPAVGGSVVHCGWNSAIEAIGAGLPVIAWPLHSEQFFNERLFVEVLEIGVRVFHDEMRIIDPEKKKVVSGEKVKEAVLKLFDNGDEAKEMRRKAKEYGKLARSAMEEVGSSSVDIGRFIEELTDLTKERKKTTTAPISD